MPLGYDVKEEVKEIGTELKSSRSDIIVGVLSFVAGTVLASSLRDISVIETVKSWFGSDQEEYEEEE